MARKNSFHRRNNLSAAITALALGTALSGASHFVSADDQAKQNKEPQSVDDLFSAAPPASQKPQSGTSSTPAATTKDSEPASIDQLFNTPPVAQQPPETKGAPGVAGKPAAPAAGKASTSVARSSPVHFSGFYRNELAYTYADQEHWSKFSNMLDVSATGSSSGGNGWKLGGRVVYDPIYDLTDYYNSQVSDNQRFEAMIRDAYFDYSLGDFDFRVGRQQIVWGEMVGLFFADVVSAKDLRESVLPDFDIIRIPQWAGRAEYYKGDFHAEAIWIPYMTYDNIGKPGSDFYPFKPPAIPGSTNVILDEVQPTRLSDSAYGLRLSYLYNGWDMSGFYYTPMDPSAAFKRLTPLTDPTIVYQPIHRRIRQTGATVGKDLGPMVLKAEAVYTQDKLFTVADPSYSDGLLQQNVLDYIVGLDWSFPQDTRFNVQLYQRWFPNYDASLSPLHRTESGFSLLLSTKAFSPRVEPQVLLIHSLNRSDWLAELKVAWQPDGHWQLTAGADIFSGPATGLFGQYNNQDRVYTEVRYAF